MQQVRDAGVRAVRDRQRDHHEHRDGDAEGDGAGVDPPHRDRFVPPADLGVVHLRVARSDAPAVAGRILRELSVADLTIEDPPIEDVIESVFAEAREAADEQARQAAVTAG